MAGSIKNNDPSNIFIPTVDLNSFQLATIIDNVVTKFTSSHRTYLSNIPVEIFINCLLKGSFSDNIKYFRTEIQCQYCIGGVVDWIQKAMKKTINYNPNRDSLDYEFGNEILIYKPNIQTILLIAQPKLEREKEVCKYCKGSGLYEIRNYKLDKIKKVKLDKDLILERMEKLK